MSVLTLYLQAQIIIELIIILLIVQIPHLPSPMSISVAAQLQTTAGDARATAGIRKQFARAADQSTEVQRRVEFLFQNQKVAC